MNKFFSLFGCALVWASPAFAHVGAGEASGWTAGLLHPLLGWDHLLAILAVGMLATQHEDRLHWEYPLTFVASLVFFAWVGIQGGRMPLMEILIAGSVILFGGMLALSRSLPPHLIWLFTALSAACHGLAHGLEATGLAAAYLGGMMLTSCGLHLTGLFLGVGLQRIRPQALQFAGAGTGLAGFVILLQTF